jgi:nicotinate-nucleotide pyrophosphorylase (carboxylating)
MIISEEVMLSVIKAALKEDVGRGDITSQLLVAPKTKIKAAIVAKEKGVVCGLDAARAVFNAVDNSIRFRSAVRDGKEVDKGTVLARLKGDARAILKAERTALNFLSHLSGIASKTFDFVQKVRPYPARIMDTRKTIPGLRVLEKYAVRCGGAFNHRMGLWDGILIKDNHLSSVSPQLLVEGFEDLIKKINRRKPRGLRIEVEVKNLQEFKKALFAGCDIIMLDNFSLKDIKEAVKVRNTLGRTIPKLEVSGGVTLSNVCRIAACGVERISIGELTHSAKALDVALNCE